MARGRVAALRVVCGWCRRNVATRYPKGGDGTAVLVREHRAVSTEPQLCAGSHALVDPHPLDTRPPG